MQKLQCELCDSIDIVKQDGMFVCQSCGCKYTLEEAKSLLSGPVAIDRSSELDNLVETARNALSDGQSARVIALCEKALTIDAEHLDCNLWYGLATAGANGYDADSVEVAASAIGRQLSYAQKKLDDAAYLKRATMSMDTATSLVNDFVEIQEVRRVSARKSASAQKWNKISQTKSLLDQSNAALEASAAKHLADAEYAASVQRVCLTVCEKMLPSISHATAIGGTLVFWEAAKRLSCEIARQIGLTPQAQSFVAAVDAGYDNWYQLRAKECGKASEYARVQEREKALVSQYESLKSERENLGLFKRDEKAALDAKIEEVRQSLVEVVEAKKKIDAVILGRG